MFKLVLLGLAGGLGALARYGIGGAVHRVMGAGFPWGTAAANLIGCFLFGLIWSLAEERLMISSQVRLIVLTGFMGSFTTFSTFIFESGMFVRDQQWFLALANLAGQNILGLAALAAGFALARLV